MALFKESDLRARAGKSTLYKSAASVLNEKVESSASVSQFDIFLSHSFSDQILILGIWLTLEDMGYRVYVDWIYDRHLGRHNVTKETAELLRERMRNSKCLFYATTENSSSSKWMPWELGYKDGHSGKCAILPISQHQSTNTYRGQEYLGIYPYVTVDPAKDDPKSHLWVRTSDTCYVFLKRGWSERNPSQEARNKGRYGY
jgi:hypothetical protein